MLVLITNFDIKILLIGLLYERSDGFLSAFQNKFTANVAEGIWWSLAMSWHVAN
jgi:hypothetical protein